MQDTHTDVSGRVASGTKTEQLPRTNIGHYGSITGTPIRGSNRYASMDGEGRVGGL